MNILLAIAVIGLVGWLALQPTWLPKPPKHRLTAGIADLAQRAGKASDGVAARADGLLARFRRLVRRPAGTDLRSWAHEGFSDNRELQTWLGGLAPAEVKRLTGELSGFCRAYGLELRWLFDEQVLPELRSGLRDVVTYYLTAAYRSRALRPLAMLERWQNAPQDAGNRELARFLYSRLVAEKLVTTPGELLMASPAERIAHVTEAIRSALIEHRERVIELVGEDPGGPAEQPLPRRDVADAPAALPAEAG